MTNTQQQTNDFPSSASILLLHIESFHRGNNLPNSPTRDADTLDDTDADLSHEDKEESHEVKGTVVPVKNKRMKRKTIILHLLQHFIPPASHFGLHFPNTGAPDQQVFTQFSCTDRCRHESTTKVFNQCDSALQRATIIRGVWGRG